MIAFRRHVAPAVTLAISGIFLAPFTARTAEEAGAHESPVTFSKDVSPIFQKSCQSCHHPGTMAPMSLMTYEEARPWARSVRQRVLTRDMPPWHLDGTVGIRDYKNDISLSDREIATIVKWVDGGAPQGNPADMPKPSSSRLTATGLSASRISPSPPLRISSCTPRGRTGGSISLRK